MDVIVAGSGPARLMTAALPRLPGYRGLDTPFPFTLTLPQRGTGHAPTAYMGVRWERVRSSAEVTAAGQPADETRVQASGTWHTAQYLAGMDGAHSDSHTTHSVTVIPTVN